MPYIYIVMYGLQSCSTHVILNIQIFLNYKNQRILEMYSEAPKIADILFRHPWIR